MKIIKEERVHTIDVYQAIDGTKFQNKVECELYENSAKCLMLSKYNKLVIKKDFEYSIFGHGSEDSYIDIVRITCKEDIDTIMLTLGLINPHMLREEHKKSYDEYQNILTRAYDDSDFVFIFRGYDEESFWIEGTLSDIIFNIAKACGHAIKYELMELDDETN